MSVESSPPLRKAPTGTSLGEMEPHGLSDERVDPVERLALGVGPLGPVAQVPVALDPVPCSSRTMKCAGGSERTRSKKVSGGWTKRRVRY